MRFRVVLFVVFASCLFLSTAFAQDNGVPSKDHDTLLQEIQTAIDAKGAKWTAGANDIFLLTKGEKRQMLGAADSISYRRIPESEQVMRYAWHPEKFSWKNNDRKNYMTPVRDQARCGSCVAFATIGTLEGQLNVYYDTPSDFYSPNLNWDLSEQHIFSCGGGTCDGGWTTSGGFDYLLTEGAPSEECYPYLCGEDGVDRMCAETCSDWRSSAETISCWGWVAGSDDVRTPAQIKEQLLKGPVATSFSVFDDFQAYTSGIYEHVYGEEPGGHAVVYVGWDDTTDPPCWILKNSWGSWGEGGYFRIRMGTNEVGIEGRCLYMTLGDVAQGDMSDVGHLYGNVDVGDSEEWDVLITNTGVADLEIYGFTTDSTGAFSVIPPSEYPQHIATGDTLLYTVSFAPDTVGFHYFRMNILSNSCRLLQDLKVRGTGVIHTVKADPKSIEETLDQGATHTVPVTVLYQGAETLTYHVEVLRDWISVEPENGTIEAGGFADFEATFDASDLEPGEYRTNILIQTDDPTDKVVVVPIQLFISEAAGVAVTLPSLFSPVSEIIDMNLYVDNATRLEAPITEANITIAFDADLLELLSITPTERLADMSSIGWDLVEPGSVTLSISDGNGGAILPGTGAVAALSFAFINGASCADTASVMVTDVSLADSLGVMLEASMKSGPVIAICKGDVNINGTVELSDVMQVVGYILNISCTEELSPECWAADFNNDGSIDAMDLVGMINMILSE